MKTKKKQYQVMASVTLEVYVPVKAETIEEAIGIVRAMTPMDHWNKSGELMDVESELTGVFEG
jgi:hypothetical protein